MNWLMQHKLVALGLIVVVAFGAWYFLSGSSSAPPTVLSPDTQSIPPGAEGLVQSLLSLKSVNLNSTVFSDPSFQVLRDFTTPITQEPAGRADPFAPLVGTAQASPATTKSAQIFAPKR